jgi:hypothetical protein
MLKVLKQVIFHLIRKKGNLSMPSIKQATEIYEKYLSEKSKECNLINVNPEISLFLKSLIEKPTRNMFNSIQKDAYKEIQKKLFQKFQESGIGKAIISKIKEEEEIN